MARKKWLCAWDKIPGDCGKLSKGTFTALWITCYGTLEAADIVCQSLGYIMCFWESFKQIPSMHVLAKYRQLSGGKYNNSLRQIYESEKKLRLLSTLKLKLKDKETTLANFDFDWNDFAYQTIQVSSWCCYAMTIFWKLKSIYP